MVDKALFSSDSAEWETPQSLFDQLNKEFHFEIDVCATAENKKCENWLGHGPGDVFTDGLRHSWGNQVCWCNPPYGREVGTWVEKACQESLKGATVVCLLPSRTDTRWFHDWVLGKAEIRFIRGRLKFQGAPSSAPFPSILAIYRPVISGYKVG